MAIANVVQKGSMLHLSDERGRPLGMIHAGDGLHGFTGTSVSVRKGSMIHNYDEKGRPTGMISAR